MAHFAEPIHREMGGPGHSHSASFDHLRRPETFRTAMATAFLWQVLARDVGNAFVSPPKDFVGVMVAAIDLRSPSDWLLDSQTVRLEWIPATRQAPRQ
jgi:hypothetical protein